MLVISRSPDLSRSAHLASLVSIVARTNFAPRELLRTQEFGFQMRTSFYVLQHYTVITTVTHTLDQHFARLPQLIN